MRLSAEQFAELYSVLQSRRPQSRHNEKRRIARIEINAHVPIELVREGKPQPAVNVVVRDVSTRGIGLLHPTPLPVGQQFICILRRHGGDDITLLCTVVHSRRTADAFYSIGAEFTCTLAHATAAADSPEMARIRQSVLG